ncbi:MAG: hypothetical protein IJ895_04910, partial [Prevotella sp.]|nr:hypothetical protein [Prevotella sp.]
DVVKAELSIADTIPTVIPDTLQTVVADTTITDTVAKRLVSLSVSSGSSTDASLHLEIVII